MWREFDELHADGHVRTIGVSTVTRLRLRRLAESDVVPAVDQIELHPGKDAGTGGPSAGTCSWATWSFPSRSSASRIQENLAVVDFAITVDRTQEMPDLSPADGSARIQTCSG